MTSKSKYHPIYSAEDIKLLRGVLIQVYSDLYTGDVCLSQVDNLIEAMLTPADMPISSEGRSKFNKLFYGSFEDVALYINDKSRILKSVALWRLKLGK